MIEDPVTDVLELSERSADAYNKDSVPYHLRTRFDIETFEQLGNTILNKDVLDFLPEQVEID
jgi:hypothetical protein